MLFRGLGGVVQYVPQGLIEVMFLCFCGVAQIKLGLRGVGFASLCKLNLYLSNQGGSGPWGNPCGA